MCAKMIQYTACVADVTSVSNRANIMLNAIDDEIIRWHAMSSEQRGGRTLGEFLGMSPSEFALFLFHPHEWSKQFVLNLSHRSRRSLQTQKCSSNLAYVN